MSKTLYLKLQGKPIPLARPRLSKYSTYNPQAELIEHAMWELKWQMENAFFALECPIRLTTIFYMPLPKKSKHEPFDAHISRPDIDNLIKFVLDAGNGIVWKDDCYISSITASKFYSEDPHTLIEVTPLLKE